MKNHVLQLIIATLILFPTVQLQSNDVFENNIIFYVYNVDGYQFNSTFSNNATLLEACSNGTKNVTIIVHGWGESINSVWTKAMIGNFSISRGGCVLFMDYSYNF